MVCVSNRIWGGCDGKKIPVAQGLYLYSIQKDGETVRNGAIAVSK